MVDLEVIAAVEVEMEQKPKIAGTLDEDVRNIEGKERRPERGKL